MRYNPAAMRVLVTGGAGFIGSHLVEAALARGHEVRVLDSLATGHLENLKALEGRLELVRGDVRQLADCARAAHGCETVFHLAALPSVQRSVEDPSGSHAVNCTGTVNVLEAARAAGAKRVVYASSSSLYGDAPALPKREDQHPAPLSPYAASKLAGELYGRAFSASMGLPVVALRLFNVFGPRQDPDSPYAAVIPIMVRALRTGKAPTLYGDGEQTRDFTYVANVVDAFLAAAEAPAAKVAGRAFNVACGGQTSLNTLYAMLQKMTGKTLPPLRKPARQGDVRHSYADASAAREALGWAPRVDLETGLRRTLDAV